MSVTEELLELLTLDYDDWDCEGADPIDPKMVFLAIEMAAMTERRARKEGLSWIEPEAGPDCCGGVDLSWKTDKGYFLLILRPCEEPGYLCVRKRSCEETPSKFRLSFGAAQYEILSLLRAGA